MRTKNSDNAHGDEQGLGEAQNSLMDTEQTEGQRLNEEYDRAHDHNDSSDSSMSEDTSDDEDEDEEPGEGSVVNIIQA